ncbi:MAG: hypothetical protein HC889_00575 [Synechococcaceae cyanobacterium SM1_2_3]|nr:hypothetical protein [Synechococcaceae cyanobacterium SM1_2_3]
MGIEDLQKFAAAGVSAQQAIDNVAAAMMRPTEAEVIAAAAVLRRAEAAVMAEAKTLGVPLMWCHVHVSDQGRISVSLTVMKACACFKDKDRGGRASSRTSVVGGWDAVRAKLLSARAVLMEKGKLRI